MYRLLFFIIFIPTILVGCNNMDNDIVRMENKLADYNKIVTDKVKALEVVKLKSEVVVINYERFIYMDYYDNVDIEGLVTKEEYLKHYDLHSVTMSNLTINTNNNTILQTMRINGTDSHMYIKIYWDSEKEDIVRIERRVNM